MKKNNAMKHISIRLISGVAALIVSSSISIGDIGEVRAEGIKTQSTSFEQKNYQQGMIIDDPLEYEESQYKQYVVKKGDNISKISKKICRYFGEDATTKYWPVLAFLNGFPRVIQPGDILIFPGTFEDVNSLWEDLNEIGWINNYVKVNDVYGKRKKDVLDSTVGDIIASIYGESVCADPDFVSLYLEVIGLNNTYSIDDVVSSYDTIHKLTDWIPTLEYLENYRKENPPILKK